jgi:hypothetical protein
LELAVDIHASIEDEQDKHGFTAYGVVDVVSLLKDEAADAAFLVIDVSNQGIGA